MEPAPRRATRTSVHPSRSYDPLGSSILHPSSPALRGEKETDEEREEQRRKSTTGCFQPSSHLIPQRLVPLSPLFCSITVTPSPFPLCRSHAANLPSIPAVMMGSRECEFHHIYPRVKGRDRAIEVQRREQKEAQKGPGRAQIQDLLCNWFWMRFGCAELKCVTSY